MPQLPSLPLDGEYPATCPTCQQSIPVKVHAVHLGTDYSGDRPVHQAGLTGEYTHTCPRPAGS